MRRRNTAKPPLPLHLTKTLPVAALVMGVDIDPDGIQNVGRLCPFSTNAQSRLLRSARLARVLIAHTRRGCRRAQRRASVGRALSPPAGVVAETRRGRGAQRPATSSATSPAP